MVDVWDFLERHVSVLRCRHLQIFGTAERPRRAARLFEPRFRVIRDLPFAGDVSRSIGCKGMINEGMHALVNKYALS